MRRLILMSALLLTLPACGVTTGAGMAGPVLDATVPTKPVDVADKTTLDERLATGATVSYTAASRLGTALASAGLIDKARFKALDAQGYAAVLAVKAAYDASNAASYAAAIDRVNAAVAGINTLVR
jgi:hypothetical protein